MEKVKRAVTKITALALSALVGISSMALPVSAAARGGTVKYTHSDYYYSKNFKFKNPFGDNFPGGWHHWDSSCHPSMITVNTGSTGATADWAYCIQPGIGIANKGKGTHYDIGNTLYWKRIVKQNREVVRSIGLALYYGYPNQIYWKESSGYYATQFIIWGLIIGYINPVTYEGNNPFMDNLCSQGKKAVRPYYDMILNRMKEHHAIPSFSHRRASKAPLLTLKWNDKTQKYEGIFTDTNKIKSLDKLSYKDGGGITYERIGKDKLKITSDHYISADNPQTARENKDFRKKRRKGDQLVWGKGSGFNQEVISGDVIPDPVPAALRFATEKPKFGKLDVIKNAEDIEF